MTISSGVSLGIELSKEESKEMASSFSTPLEVSVSSEAGFFGSGVEVSVTAGTGKSQNLLHGVSLKPRTFPAILTA